MSCRSLGGWSRRRVAKATFATLNVAKVAFATSCPWCIAGPERPAVADHAEMVETIGSVLGRTLRYEEVPADVAAKGMVMRGFPEPFVGALMNRYRRLAGLPGLVTDGVAEVLGRPPRSYADWVADNVAAFRN